jgi:beta-glucanase (GH16 family)
MRLLVTLCACAFLFAASAASAEPKRRLIWSDEFSGEALDYRCWTPETWKPGNNGGELQRFTASPRNIAVADGVLTISAFPETTGAGAELRRYTSAQIMSVNNGYWTYGYFEARIRAPRGAGAFPAFWMMPQLNEWGWWPNSGEIDIWEYIGRDEQMVYTALHYQGEDWKGGRLQMPRPLWEDYHLYALEWLPDRMRWYVDGQLMWEKTAWKSPDPRRPRAPFDSPFYMILNLSLGGEWPGPPTAQTRWPLQLSVDYVRVYAIDGAPAARTRVTKNKESRCPGAGPGGETLIASGQPPLGVERPLGGRRAP